MNLADTIREAIENIDAGYQAHLVERAAALRQLHETYDMERAPGWVQMLLLSDDTPVVSRRLAERVQQELDKVRRP